MRLTRRRLRRLVLAALVATISCTAARAQAPGEAPRAPAGPEPAPATLSVWNRPIVVFRAPIRQVSPAQRAAGAAKRIEALLDDIRPEDVRADPTLMGDLRGVLLTARGHLLFALLPEDVDPASDETLESVSHLAVDRLRDALRARAEQRRLPVLLAGIALSLGATALFGVALYGIGRAAKRILGRLATMTQAESVHRVGVDLLPFLNTLERGLVKLTGWALVVVCAYLWLTFVLHQFPYSRPWGAQLRTFLAASLADLGLRALHATPGLFTVLVIFLAARVFTRAIGALFRAVESDTVALPGLNADTARATRQIATAVVWLFALTVAYPYIPGSETEAFKAIGVFAGLMVTLGSAGWINQVMSGLVVVYSRALRPGELVRSGDIVGLVSEVGLLSTRIVTPRREQITIPNAVLVASTVTNYSRLADAHGAVLSTSITIGYDAPWRQVHSLLVLAAERTAGIRAEPRPYVVQRALSDFYVDYELRVHLDQAEDRFQVLSDLHAQIQDAFNEFGVQIMSPAFESQPDQPVVVPKSHWYAAPAKRPTEAAGDGGSRGPDGGSG